LSTESWARRLPPMPGSPSLPSKAIDVLHVRPLSSERATKMERGMSLRLSWVTYLGSLAKKLANRVPAGVNWRVM
jgi:hypothetical protein